MSKICCKCKIPKELNDFHKWKNSKDGHAVTCKQCCAIAHQLRYQKADKEQRKLKNKEYYQTNKERILTQGKQYRDSTKGTKSSRKQHFKQRYNIGLEVVDELLLDCDYRCEICGDHKDDTPKQVLCVDHDHHTGKIRGMLCFNCNTGIGQLKDDTDIIQRALNYLHYYNLLELQEHSLMPNGYNESESYQLKLF